MNDDKQNIAQFLYEQKTNSEIYPESADGEALAILEMLSELRSVGYPFDYFADIELRTIKEPKIMEIMLKYYPRMESVYTKATLLRKINPKKFPKAVDYALKEYQELSPLNKMQINGFQDVLIRAKWTDEYEDMLLQLISKPDNYASSFFIVKALSVRSPTKLKEYSVAYSKGVLLPATLSDFSKYGDEQSIDVLKKASEITKEDIKKLFEDKSYLLCMTMYEYWKNLCTVENIRYTAKRLLKKVKN